MALHGYALLFYLTVIALNPFALSRGTIWTQPKILCVAIVVIVHILTLCKGQQQLIPSKQWWLQFFAWIIFLFFGLISTLLSPFPVVSLLGHAIAADGLLYWFLIAGFVLTNSLLLSHHPNLFHYQLRGVLVGATLVAPSMYPQLIDWRIDYTFHSGQVWEGTEHVLVTAVYRDHQPIGLYSHRGFAGFTLAIASVLALVAIRNRWLLPRTALPLVVLYTVTLSLAKVRGAMLGMLAGWLWLCLIAPQSKRVSQILILLSLIGILSFGWATTERRVRNAEIYASTPFEVALKHFTSDRVHLWQKAWVGFLERPWFGWGFSGYSIANAAQLCSERASLIAVEDYYAYCRDIDGNVTEMETESTKAHNLVLDQYVSLGLFGASSYFLLLGCYLLNLFRANPSMLSASVTYVIYTLTWYDSGQFSHIGWWIFSVNFLNRNV